MQNLWKKSAATFAAAVLMLSIGHGAPASAKAKTATSSYTVSLVSETLESNDHVGNEWYTEASAGGRLLEEGDTVTLNVKAGGAIELKAAAIEQDKIPDEGTASKSVKVSSISKTGSVIKLKVVVTENRGRYSGNQAVWVFTYSVKAK
ncbi:hypothetical protein Q5741_05650 [Paenibacillus sp. JX-17]|uniref:WxL domain-containing protein n=1 Tax=Paenibacillus lacisoli TaxID=3064525 RepID=A0ABT9C9G7_9BACL|nr:hypothetical protein [Paenibacillus sp. JX-17]MDO7905901.1 hypothetical protein [Paenibacillus sp. JX-17]